MCMLMPKLMHVHPDGQHWEFFSSFALAPDKGLSVSLELEDLWLCWLASKLKPFSSLHPCGAGARCGMATPGLLCGCWGSSHAPVASSLAHWAISVFWVQASSCRQPSLRLRVFSLRCWGYRHVLLCLICTIKLFPACVRTNAYRLYLFLYIYT